MVTNAEVPALERRGERAAPASTASGGTQSSCPSISRESSEKQLGEGLASSPLLSPDRRGAPCEALGRRSSSGEGTATVGGDIDLGDLAPAAALQDIRGARDPRLPAPWDIMTSRFPPADIACRSSQGRSAAAGDPAGRETPGAEAEVRDMRARPDLRCAALPESSPTAGTVGRAAPPPGTSEGEAVHAAAPLTRRRGAEEAAGDGVTAGPGRLWGFLPARPPEPRAGTGGEAGGSRLGLPRRRLARGEISGLNLSGGLDRRAALPGKGIAGAGSRCGMADLT